MRIRRFLEDNTRFGTLIIGAILISIIGYFDTVTAREISFCLLYLVVICYITWFVGRSPGMMASLASAMICFFDEYTSADFIENRVIPYWNAGSLFGIFLIVVYLLSEFKGILKKNAEDAQ